MKIYFLHIVLACLLVAGCSKKEKAEDSSNISDIIFGLKTDSTTILADGTSLIHVSCDLNQYTTSDRMKILFKINTGKFVTNSDTTIEVAATFIDSAVVAHTVILVPQTPGMLYITAQPDIPGLQNNHYILTDSVVLRPSLPASIVVTGSTAGINSNYGSEITVTGTLANSVGGKVSFLGYKANFNDTTGIGNNLGNWRPIVDTPNAMSQVSAAYSFGSAPVGTKIALTITILDPAGNPIPVTGSINIFINK